jgi:hypothetical protein
MGVSLIIRITLGESSRSPTLMVADVIQLTIAHFKLNIIFYVHGVLVFFGGFS